MKENAKIIWSVVWRMFAVGVHSTVVVTTMTDLIDIIQGKN